MKSARDKIPRRPDAVAKNRLAGSLAKFFVTQSGECGIFRATNEGAKKILIPKIGTLGDQKNFCRPAEVAKKRLCRPACGFFCREGGRVKNFSADSNFRGFLIKKFIRKNLKV